MVGLAMEVGNGDHEDTIFQENVEDRVGKSGHSIAPYVR
jgi:hypothetical protein